MLRLQSDSQLLLVSCMLKDFTSEPVKISPYIDLFSFLCAEGLCWARTAERQTSRIRVAYLKSVLRQEVGFFDTQEAGSSTTYKVVTAISSDANLIQVAICEKVKTHKNQVPALFSDHTQPRELQLTYLLHEASGRATYSKTFL